jgi:type IV pilus assembly protein PilF
MKPEMRRMAYAGAICLTFALALGGLWALAANLDSNQAAPSTGPSQTRLLTLEERADIYMARKKYDDAVDYYYRALKQTKLSNPVLWNKLGIAFQVQTKFQRARKAYTNATRLDKNFADAWNNIGTVLFMEKKYAKSVKYYQHAISLKSGVASFHMNLGTSYYHLKKFDLAVEEYRTALGIDPKVVALQSSVGTVVHASETDVEYFFYMAKAFASVGDADEAVRYLRRALEDGFNKTDRITADPDFQKISQYPAFVELMRNPPVPIKD